MSGNNLKDFIALFDATKYTKYDYPYLKDIFFKNSELRQNIIDSGKKNIDPTPYIPKRESTKIDAAVAVRQYKAKGVIYDIENHFENMIQIRILNNVFEDDETMLARNPNLRGKKKLFHRSNRENYKRVPKTICQAAPNYLILTDNGAVELRQTSETQGIIEMMIDDWSWMKLEKEIYIWVKTVGIDSVIRNVIVDYYDAQQKWNIPIIQLLTDYDFMNSSIAKMYSKSNAEKDEDFEKRLRSAVVKVLDKKAG